MSVQNAEATSSGWPATAKRFSISNRRERQLAFTALLHGEVCMFGDLFGGVSAEQVNQSNQAHAVNYLTLTLVLIEKGIISADEIEIARSTAIHFVEQEWARKREDQEREFEEKHPGLRKLFGHVFGMDSSV